MKALLKYKNNMAKHLTHASASVLLVSIEILLNFFWSSMKNLKMDRSSILAAYQSVNGIQIKVDV